jgi:hypothetical protein
VSLPRTTALHPHPSSFDRAQKNVTQQARNDTLTRFIHVDIDNHFDDHDPRPDQLSKNLLRVTGRHCILLVVLVINTLEQLGPAPFLSSGLFVRLCRLPRWTEV